MSDKRELLEDDSALTTLDLDPDNICVMPEAIAIASDGASWTAHIKEYLSKTNFHAGTAIHPEKAEIGKAVSLGQSINLHTKRRAYTAARLRT